MNFWTKFAQERYLWQTEKVNIIVELRLFKFRLYQILAETEGFDFFDQIYPGFSGLKQKEWTPHIFYIILHIQISLVWNFSANWQFLLFGSNLHKKLFPVKNGKSYHHHWIPHIQISLLVPNFCFNWQFWFFWPDLSKKGFSGLKQKKWTPHIFYIILHIQISLVRNFSSNWQFWFFGPNLPKKVFPVENRKSKHPHGVLYTWISLGTKFQLKLIKRLLFV